MNETRKVQHTTTYVAAGGDHKMRAKEMAQYGALSDILLELFKDAPVLVHTKVEHFDAPVAQEFGGWSLNPGWRAEVLVTPLHQLKHLATLVRNAPDDIREEALKRLLDLIDNLP
jgi:hypothetical protein